MKNYNNINDLAMAYALSNISEGVNNDLVSEIEFVKTAVIRQMNAMSAQRIGINGKCHIIKNFGYAII